MNQQGPIDAVNVALSLGATFVARSFSGDKAQLVPICSRQACSHRGFAFIDVISPCVTFNDHVGSTKSYAHTRTHMHEVIETDFVPIRTEISTEYAEGTVRDVKMHDGSTLRLRKVEEAYDPTDRAAVIDYLGGVVRQGEVPTGLLYLAEAGADMHDFSQTVEAPLVDVPFADLCPGSSGLEEVQKEWW